MHLQLPESSGPAGPAGPGKQQPVEGSSSKISQSLPFGQHLPLSSISGPTYLTAQTLIQQVAYVLSDKLFTYSPGTFDLDVAVRKWFSEGTLNGHGYSTGVSSMQTRTGAASIALGYMFSNDFDLKKRYIPQSVLASSSSLHHLRDAFDQLSLLYPVASPLVAHIAAVDYAGASSSGLVTDYASALTLSEDLGFGLVSSFSAYESQHMSLFSTLMASIIPTIHIYDGIHVGMQTTRVVDVLDSNGLRNAYKAIVNEISGLNKKNSNTEGQVDQLLTAFNGELGTDYGLFQYYGHETPDSVLVVFGTVESSLASQVASTLAEDGAKVGVVAVRVYRPFVEKEFLAVLPKSVQALGVLGQVPSQTAVSESACHSNLYADVLATVTFANSRSSPPSVTDIKYSRDHTWNPQSIAVVLRQLGRKPGSQRNGQSDTLEGRSRVRTLNPSSVQQYTFWDLDDAVSVTAPNVIGQTLARDSANNITVKVGHDNLVQGGTVRTDIRVSKKAIEAAYPVEEADLSYVGADSLLTAYNILGSLKTGGTLILKLPGAKDEELEKKLPVHLRRGLYSKNIRLYLLNPQASDTVVGKVELEEHLVRLCFLSLERNDLLACGLEKLAGICGDLGTLECLAKDLDKVLRRVEVPESWAVEDIDMDSSSLPADITVNSFSAFEKVEPEPPSLLRTWQIAAKGLAFKEAYDTKPALRPDLSVKTYTAYVKENRRLTPENYDRNIFHIEFDISKSGLRYDIGEALGIHGENDPGAVQEFIEFYGLEPEEIVEVPSREDPMVLENRTVYQALMQNVDIFGRPPKRFYEALSEFANDENEKKELLTLGGGEGANEFKRRAEVDTITYADILLEFPSAHPSFHDIVRIVNPMKRREYSIASSQKVTPDSVALLVVVVSWVDPKGRDRFGQATRYLNKLKIGAPVTVSVKPSVMKLPPKATQPLVMAGLGTGLAPFRAFVQYRAWQKSQGIDIGSVLLYMGSRHQREEYLYGEEWEAYQDAGVITLLGRAFSRDQPQKIYIQDRMRQTMNDIIQAYIKDEGAFYLCGPTWPVPDVTEVLQEAIARDAQITGRKVDSRKEIERLKDALRYVLEVY
ncbi:MAG: hypothetical protein M1835_007614 [Candelina submexicana]|nr:MAG: hypothetical protein M1835_007614 [Candelina submexicana]